MRITRLGEGVDANRRLAPAAIARTVEVLREFRGRMDAHGVSNGRLIATSAVRDAANRDEFLDAATAAADLQAELLTGDEEARTAFAGATRDLPHVNEDTVVVDVGGGSTELAIGRQGDVRAMSLDIGCVRLTERILHHDPPTEGELKAASEVIDRALQEASTCGLALEAVSPGCRLVGLAGTVATLAMLQQQLVRYDRAKVHHFLLLWEQVERWRNVLAGETAADRRRRPGMEQGRQDVIVGGVLVLQQVMRRLGVGSCLTSESDILDGLVASLRNRAPIAD